MITNTLFSSRRLHAASFRLLLGTFCKPNLLGVTATLFLSLCLCLLIAPDGFGQTTVTSFSYNGTDGTDGSPQSFTVPTGVTQLTVVAFGAAGGSLSSRQNGGRVDAVMSVTRAMY